MSDCQKKNLEIEIENRQTERQKDRKAESQKNK